MDESSPERKFPHTIPFERSSSCSDPVKLQHYRVHIKVCVYDIYLQTSHASETGIVFSSVCYYVCVRLQKKLENTDNK